MVNAPSASHALDVLELLARRGEPLPAATVARELGLPRSSTYHLLGVLRDRGYVSHLEGERRYGLGVAAYELGSAYGRQAPLQRMARATLDRLGMEARSGTLTTGSDRIEQAARGGKVKALLYASDASLDGRRKLDQAWRVGGSEEMGHRHGLEIPVERTILSMALGRENVVHVALTDPGAAARVLAALTRWRAFIVGTAGVGRGDDAVGPTLADDE